MNQWTDDWSRPRRPQGPDDTTRLPARYPEDDRYDDPLPGWEPERRRRITVWRVLLALVLVLILLTGGLLYWLNSKIEHIDALTSGGPAATPGEDWLLIGSDSREGLSDEQRAEMKTGKAAGRRADSIMLLHVPDGGGEPTLVSLPRDSYVEIPGRGKSKLNAAYAYGGPELMTSTVENATGIKIDRYLEIGFDGFVNVVDEIGGVEVCPEKPIKDKAAGLDIPAGCQTLDGAESLGYVRARKSDPRGDLGRVERQQEFLAGLTEAAVKPSVALNPFRSLPMASASMGSLRADQDCNIIDLAKLAWVSRKLGGDEAVTTTVPVSNPDYRPGGVGSTVKWDTKKAKAMFGALQRDEPVPPEALPEEK